MDRQYTYEEVLAAAQKVLGSGMSHPSFLATVGRLRPAARTRLEEVAPAFC